MDYLSLASIGTISACLFLFGLFYCIVCNFQYMIKNAETSVGVTVFFQEGTADDVIKSIGDSIKARTEVDRIESFRRKKHGKNSRKKCLRMMKPRCQRHLALIILLRILRLMKCISMTFQSRLNLFHILTDFPGKRSTRFGCGC